MCILYSVCIVQVDYVATYLLYMYLTFIENVVHTCAFCLSFCAVLNKHQRNSTQVAKEHNACLHNLAVSSFGLVPANTSFSGSCPFLSRLGLGETIGTSHVVAVTGRKRELCKQIIQFTIKLCCKGS